MYNSAVSSVWTVTVTSCVRLCNKPRFAQLMLPCDISVSSDELHVHKVLPRHLSVPAGPTSHHWRLAVNQMFPGHSAWNDKAPGCSYFFHGHRGCCGSSRTDLKKNCFTVYDVLQISHNTCIKWWVSSWSLAGFCLTCCWSQGYQCLWVCRSVHVSI